MFKNIFAAVLFFWIPLVAQADLERGYQALRAGDYAAAYSEFRAAADQGDAAALFELGLLYADGRGVDRNVSRAAELYDQARLKGNGPAANNLGVLYADGRGVERNVPRAVLLFAMAHHLGVDVAQNNIRNNLGRLDRFDVSATAANVREQPSTESPAFMTLNRGASVYGLWQRDGWWYVFIPDRNTVGFMHPSVLSSGAAARPEAAAQGNSSRFPAAPAVRPGVLTCNTRCFNGDCYRTYGDGRQVRFQAAQRFNPFTRQMEWDSGTC